jgi:Protein of unknown function (DUF2630)
MDEKSILSHIHDLVAEEHELRSRHVGDGLDDTERERLRRIEAELDQTWDLLRQRRARSEYGDDPDNAETRDPAEVETYLQ